ncbi:hypothetical protein CSAL01_13352 [Colletotrichum salicis]|uniref:Heterokaryon incompatibility domain-containing protein n=1 Tax=Colletotrichum salicis TaxID=1209931 RepID=A0A135V6Y0_9PEZI|nr:hypothetical protein CSAL01_13352 [Colletotrichum salicis]
MPHGLFIRYLVLQVADKPSDGITCTLHTCHLDDVPTFEAISYVWGTPVKDQEIICNGKTIEITANLLDVLRQVRHAYQPRTLWVDSICINQSDTKEKGHQPWFRRGWVVQEAALGPGALVLWAGYEIDWLKLVRTYVWSIRRVLRLPNIHKLWLSDLHLQGFYTRRNLEAATFQPEGAVEPLNCLETLDHARWLDVTDPRDRIYGFLSLLRQEKPVPLPQPSYEVPYLSLYLEFASELLRSSQDLDILHFVHNDNNTLEDDFPSWVPRWNIRLYSSYTGTLNNYNRNNKRIVSEASPLTITLSEDRATLKVRVVSMDQVAFKAQFFDKDTTTHENVASLWQLVSSKDVSFYPCTLLRAFISIFRCGVYRGRLT